jgi:hypothetical protein
VSHQERWFSSYGSRGSVARHSDNINNNWTNSTFGLYPSSGVSKKIEELKIYILNITIHTSTRFTQGSITNHRATYLGAYTHKPLKQVRHRWQ